MRHRKGRAKLGRTSAHRQAMMSNMMLGLIEHGRVQTTEAKARELRRVAERMITRATRLGDIIKQDHDKLKPEEKAKIIHAMRTSRTLLRDPKSVIRLFRHWAPRYIARPGGYTRLFKLGPRKGDNAPMVMLELIDGEEELDSSSKKPVSAATSSTDESANVAPKKAKTKSSK